MKSENNHIGDTVRVLRPPPRVFTTTVGQNVWMGEVEDIELELEESLESDPYNSAPAHDLWSRARTG